MALRAVPLGFILSMVFGHALIILPAVARIRTRFGPALYASLATLHASVALRVASDFLGAEAGRRWIGLVTATAVAGLASCTCRTMRRTSAPIPPARFGHSAVPSHVQAYADAGSRPRRAGTEALELHRRCLRGPASWEEDAPPPCRRRAPDPDVGFRRRD